MNVTIVPDLDLTGLPVSLSHPIDPQSMTYFHRGQTQAQLAKALFQVIYTPVSHRNRFWVLTSEVECLLTYLVCFYLIYQKTSLGKMWLISKRDSPYGRFYISNAIFVLSLGVLVYLIVWDITGSIIVGFSYARRSTMEWWWTIPLPWWPLVVGAYISIHGCTVSCSPRSPLAVNGTQIPTGRKRWIYLPLPKSSLVLNAILIIPCVLFTVSTVTLIGLSGHSFFKARVLAHQIVPVDIMEQVHRSFDRSNTFVGQDSLASDELIWAARRVGAAYMETHRYVCINLAVFAAVALAMEIPLIVYSLPILVLLVDHSCSRLPEPLRSLSSTKGFLRKSHFLLTKGKPQSSEQSIKHLDLTTWKMTALSMGYVSILASVVPAFAMVPVYIVRRSFPEQVLRGNISGCIEDATIAVSVITIASCTTIAVFCTVVTLDPLFRAALGLNRIRTHVPINIQSVVHKTMREGEMPDSVDEVEHPMARMASTSTLKSSGSPESSGKLADETRDHVYHHSIEVAEAGRRVQTSSFEPSSI